MSSLEGVFIGDRARLFGGGVPKVVGSVLAKVSIANDFSFYFR